jgi:hypothetical protein
MALPLGLGPPVGRGRRTVASPATFPTTAARHPTALRSRLPWGLARASRSYGLAWLGFGFALPLPCLAVAVALALALRGNRLLVLPCRALRQSITTCMRLGKPFACRAVHAPGTRHGLWRARPGHAVNCPCCGLGVRAHSPWHVVAASLSSALARRASPLYLPWRAEPCPCHGAGVSLPWPRQAFCVLCMCSAVGLGARAIQAQRRLTGGTCSAMGHGASAI